jgi:hypothetical protein
MARGANIVMVQDGEYNWIVIGKNGICLEQVFASFCYTSRWSRYVTRSPEARSCTVKALFASSSCARSLSHNVLADDHLLYHWPGAGTRSPCVKSIAAIILEGGVGFRGATYS